MMAGEPSKLPALESNQRPTDSLSDSTAGHSWAPPSPWLAPSPGPALPDVTAPATAAAKATPPCKCPDQR
jgi:hypothetical protein